MGSDNGVLIDLREVGQVVERADVFVVGFPHFAERLLVDTRSSEAEGPMVRVVEPLGSVQERIFWLGKERGSFGMPEAFTFFNWPHSIAFLTESGVWQRIQERVHGGTDPRSAAQCEAALERLRELDKASMLAAVGGEGYVSLWAHGQGAQA